LKRYYKIWRKFFEKFERTARIHHKIMKFTYLFIKNMGRYDRDCGSGLNGKRAGLSFHIKGSESLFASVVDSPWRLTAREMCILIVQTISQD
jgi:hypothetical protein